MADMGSDRPLVADSMRLSRHMAAPQPSVANMLNGIWSQIYSVDALIVYDMDIHFKNEVEEA